MKVSVVRDDGPIIKTTIEEQHYLHRWPDPRSLPFSYRLIVDDCDFASDGLPNGVVVFKKPQHHKQRGLFGYEGLPTAWQVLDMARVWVHPCWQTSFNSHHSICMFTRMVSRAIKRVQWDWLRHHPPRYPHAPYHIERIISYCELAHHEGTAYKAASFSRFGMTADGKKETYVKVLRPPLRSWSLSDCCVAQPALFAGMPIYYP